MLKPVLHPAGILKVDQPKLINNAKHCKPFLQKDNRLRVQKIIINFNMKLNFMQVYWKKT